jgi:hypothetical protein
MQTYELQERRLVIFARRTTGAVSFSAMTLLVSLAGCAPYGESCLRNSDCKGGEVCVASACRLELEEDGDASLDQGGVVDAVSLVRDVTKSDLVIPLPDDVKSTDVSAESSVDSGTLPDGGAEREAAADASVGADGPDALKASDSASASEASDASDASDAVDLRAADSSVDSARE